MHRVHLKNGPWVTAGGYEYNLVLIAAVLALTEAGPGPLSIDRAVGRERSGTGWALAAAAAGAVGAAGVHYAAQAASAPSEPAETAPAPDAPTAEDEAAAPTGAGIA